MMCTRCICYAQTADSHHPGTVSREARIIASRRNARIAQINLGCFPALRIVRKPLIAYKPSMYGLALQPPTPSTHLARPSTGSKCANGTKFL